MHGVDSAKDASVSGICRSSSAESHKYRPDIDGLRALAVLAVLFFHAHVAGFSGGFVGVDIFYVISGYLITSLIVKDLVLERFSFISFYERRIRRIFPALFAVLLICTVVACTLLTPKDLLAYGKSMVAMTFFTSNVFFKHDAKLGGYFARASDSQALLHTWSLSVEEQFYLLFPAALFCLYRWTKGRRMGWWLAGGAVASFGLSAWTTVHHPLTAFYILLPRAWELLLGSLLALNVLPPVKRRAFREVLGLVGIGLIAWAMSAFTKETTFPGVSALLPCVGAGLVVYVGEGGPSQIKSALSLRPLVLLGLVSYSLYLCHWPIIVFTRYFSAEELTPITTVWVIILSLATAFLSFRFIESPFRGSGSRITRQRIFALGFAASMVSAIIGFVIVYGRGLPGRYDETTRQLVLENTERKEDYQEECGNWKHEIHTMSDIKFCEVDASRPSPRSSKRILFWGDSHVQQLYPLIKKLNDDGGLQDHGALLAIANGCAPTEHLNSIGKGYYCDTFAKFAMARAEDQDVDTVFIGFNTWWVSHEAICLSVDSRCVERLSVEETRHRFLHELAGQIHVLKMHGKRVIVSLPFPMFDKSIPDLEVRNAVFGRFGLGGVATDITRPEFGDEVASVSRSAGAEIFDPRKSLCSKQGCITEFNGVSIYKDDNHIAASQVGILESNLREILRYGG
jgi:peptidoglycan/LPS O-acetylase OafA/YrhL